MKNTPLYTYHYRRHYVDYTDTASDIDAAAKSAYYDCEFNEAYAIGLFDEHGTLVMDREALLARGAELCGEND